MGNKAPSKTFEGKKVVIVGGGYAGVGIARKLEDIGFEVTLIDRKSFFFHSVGALRTSYKEGWEDIICIPYTKVLQRDGAVVHGDVVEINTEKKHVAVVEGNTKSKKEVNYDYLILATGAPVPASFPARVPPHTETQQQFADQVKEFRTAIKEANDIVVIGGGPVGVELCGEIRDGYPSKKITLINSSDALLSNSQPPLKKETTDRVQQKLEKMNVTVILGKKVDLSFWEEGKNYITGSREITLEGTETKVKADLVISCIGNHHVLEVKNGKEESLFPKDWVDDKGQVKVNKYLQVEAVTEGSVFALGDITNLNESKLAYYAGMHCDTLFGNICSVANGKQESLKEYTAQEKANMMVPLGAKDGVVELGGRSLPGFMGKKLCFYAKGKSLMVERFYPLLNQPIPKL